MFAEPEFGNSFDRVLTMERLLFMCGKYMKEEGQLDGNTIVTTIMSNMGLYKACC